MTKVHFDVTAVAEKSKLDFLVDVVFCFAVSFPLEVRTGLFWKKIAKTNVVLPLNTAYTTSQLGNPVRVCQIAKHFKLHNPTP